eukprot:9469234-Pyramimonas_sp.AAC.1
MSREVSHILLTHERCVGCGGLAGRLALQLRKRGRSGRSRRTGAALLRCRIQPKYTSASLQCAPSFSRRVTLGSVQASVIIEDLGTPEKIIKAFGPEILGKILTPS